VITFTDRGDGRYQARHERDLFSVWGSPRKLAALMWITGKVTDQPVRLHNCTHPSLLRLAESCSVKEFNK
jgi:hypothetical protein